jgi:hypothetical protein
MKHARQVSILQIKHHITALSKKIKVWSRSTNSKLQNNVCAKTYYVHSVCYLLFGWEILLDEKCIKSEKTQTNHIRKL